MKNWFKVFSLYFIFGLLVYFNSLNNKFLLDDYVFLKDPVYSSTKFILSQWNPYREEVLGVLGGQLGYYRPMAHMVLDACYAAFKNNFWQYHLLNLFLFVFASLLVYLLIVKISGNYILAFLAGFFYLIHPINGIIVNYISASVFALQVICTLGTLLLLLESLERKNNQALYFLSLLLSFLSLFWNESGVMTPFYISAAVLFFRRDSYKEKIFYLFPYFLIVLLYLVFRHFFISTNDLLFKKLALYHMTAGEYGGALFQVYGWYISKLLYPHGIVMQWTTPILHDHIMGNVLGMCLLLALTFLLLIRFFREKICRFSLILILIGFAPVCLAAFRAPENGAQIEPHWFVFSSIGFFILAAHFCIKILDRSKQAGILLLFIIVFVWGSMSHADNLLWADQKTYAQYWVKQAPYFKSTYFYLADAYSLEGAFKESKKYYKLALSGRPSDVEIYNNLGGIDQAEGHYKEAELSYKMALKIFPSSAPACNNLGSVYFAQGQYGKAKEYFIRSLMYDPLMLEPRRSLASISLKHAEYQKAIDLCRKNLDIVNDDPKTLLLLVDIYAQKNDPVTAAKYANRIIAQGADPGVLTELGIDLARHHLPQLALACFMKAVHTDPGYKNAYLATGTLLANLGRYDQAIIILRIGSNIDHTDNRFKDCIAKIEELKLKKSF